MVGGMNANFSNFDSIKDVGAGFRDVFSDKEFKGEDSNYPYSQEYIEKIKDNALRRLERAGAAAFDNLSEVHLGGSSGSEAVRQARINASDMTKKPNEVRLKDDN